MNNKPMKKYVNGVLNRNYVSKNRPSNSSRNFSEDSSMFDDIKKRSEDKKIHDSILDKHEEKTEKSSREDTYEKVEKAKELLGIKKTKNDKSDTLDNYKLEYRRKHELRDFSSNEEKHTNIDYDDVFRDL